ncbi:DNA repair protein crb2 [Podospora fimiseda]|uniref:DNA repair protein crb2 n=1 Tax=Podospora fimiseda TaxID=252190 RepID=A0AAN7BVE8_9PEZI|nr:DNA repair protein crb2 [Podospora fimiseda]
MSSKSLRKAEERALQGDNESQDTLAVAEFFIEEYGIGLRSSSPPRQVPLLPSPVRSSVRKSRPFKSRARDVKLTVPLPASRQSHAEIDVGQVGALPRREKMSSSQSSTQSNTGRNYERYFEEPSPGHALPDTQAPGMDDDNGTVRFNFEKIAGTEFVPEAIQNDSGFVDTGSLAHPKRHDSQKQKEISLPETPAPQNPFRHSRSQLLPTSQLFRATQFSSAIKVASPTSSRPSPAEFPHNNIISSPLKDRGLRSSSASALPSSPQVFATTRPSRLREFSSSPDDTASTGDPVTPESSHDALLRKRSPPEPMADYEPLHRSQERRTSDIGSDPVQDDDNYDEEEDDDDISRRLRAKFKKAAGLKSLSSISIPHLLRPFDDKASKPKSRDTISQADAYIVQCHGTEPGGTDSDATEVVKDSQVKDSEPEQLPVPRPIAAPLFDNEEPTQSDIGKGNEDAVDQIPAPAPEVTIPQTSSGNELQGENATTTVTSNGEKVPETSQNRAQPPSLENKISASEGVAGNFKSSPPTFSKRRTRTKAAAQHKVRPPSASSSLSNLEMTPIVSPASTDKSGAVVSPMDTSTVANSSPAIGRPTRRQKALNPRASTESLRHSSRLLKRVSSSPDELAMSATPAFEHSMRMSRLPPASRSASRSGRAIGKPPVPQGRSKLFSGMAFAISFQSKKAGETNDAFSARMDLSSTIERRITQAGGKILENGFDELFDIRSSATPMSSPNGEPESEIPLSVAGRSMGFTALIADGHSRKVKYMQALALGLPCIAARWVTVCMDRNELVDWSPYLLCAGESSFLGNAIRSRSLTPYDPSTAKLADIIRQRDRFLDGSRILAVVKKPQENKKMAYVFLARILGATISRVYNVEEARIEIKAAEDSGRPFDWIYVDGKVVEKAIFSEAPPSTNNKRKRASMGADKIVGPPTKKIRTLNDELVIQSLILGRMIEEGELEE